jgi:hypothetical protein
MYVVESMIVRSELEFLLFIAKDSPEMCAVIKTAFEHILRNERFVEED